MYAVRVTTTWRDPPIDSDHVVNKSPVAGATVTDALVTLSDAIGGVTTDDVTNMSEVVGATASDALNTLADDLAAEAAARVAADALLAPLASPALTGVPSAPTAAPGTNTTQLATTAFVAAAAAVTWDAALANGATAARDAVMASAAVSLRGADGAVGAGLSLRGGNGSAGSGAGVAVTGGSSSGANAGSSVTISPGAVVSGTRGRVLISHSGPNTDEVVEVSAAGTNGAACQVFASAVAPSGVVSANVGDVCLFDDGTRGDIFVKDTGNANATGWRGIPTVYTSSVVLRPKRWVGSATVAGGAGNWTADISSADFAAVTAIQATAVNNAASSNDRAFGANVGSNTLTSVSGKALVGKGVLLGGTTIDPAPNGTVVYVTVDGT